MDFGRCHRKSTPAAEPNSDGGPPLMPADRPQYRLCPHPGELARRVMSTHPASVNADSTAGERRVTENGGVRIRRDAPRGRCDRNRVTGEIRYQSPLYGLLDRVRDLGLGLVSVQPQPAADPPTDDKETYRYSRSQTPSGRSLAARYRRQHMEIRRNDTAARLDIAHPTTFRV